MFSAPVLSSASLALVVMLVGCSRLHPQPDAERSFSRPDPAGESVERRVEDWRAAKAADVQREKELAEKRAAHGDENPNSGPVRVEIVVDPKGRAGAADRRPGHGLNYRIDGTPCADLDALRAAIEKRLAASRQPLPVVIDPGPGSMYGDVAPVVDMVVAAGVKDIDFAGALGARKKKKE